MLAPVLALVSRKAAPCCLAMSSALCLVTCLASSMSALLPTSNLQERGNQQREVGSMPSERLLKSDQHSNIEQG